MLLLVALCVGLPADAAAATFKKECGNSGGFYTPPQGLAVPPRCVCDEGTKFMQGKDITWYWTGTHFTVDCFIQSCGDMSKSTGPWSTGAKAGTIALTETKCATAVDAMKQSLSNMCDKYCQGCSRTLGFTQTISCLDGMRLEDGVYETDVGGKFECMCVNPA